MNSQVGRRSTRKTIGIIGGMSPESTVVYYEHIHRAYRARYADDDYPPVVVYSVPFGDCRRWTKARAWGEAAEALSEAARRLHAAGADFALIGANTMHLTFEAVQSASPIPLLNIIDVVAEAVKRQGIGTVGLLGTQVTMQHPFYRDRLLRHGLATIVPPLDAQIEINRVIYEELTRGIVRPESREAYQRVIRELGARGAQGVILGCTEIPLLIQPADSPLAVFDSTRLHVEAALATALGEMPIR